MRKFITSLMLLYLGQSALAQTLQIEDTSLVTEPNQKFYELQIVDKTGIMLKQYNYSNGVNQANINLSDLHTGLYLIRVWNGKEWIDSQIIKN